MRRLALATTMLLALGAGAQAADQVKLGFITPFSGPISRAGSETKRGIDLALEELGNKLGGCRSATPWSTTRPIRPRPCKALEADRRRQGRFCHRVQRLEYDDPDLEDVQRCRHFRVGALAGPASSPARNASRTASSSRSRTTTGRPRSAST